MAGKTCYYDPDAKRDLATGSRAGAELGVVSNISFGHFAVQPKHPFKTQAA